MGERYTLPVLPLRDTVVYPGVAVPISAGRPGTVEAVQEALDGDRRLFAVAQKENVDEPTPDVLYKIGTVVRIIQTHRVRGGVQLLVQGEGRAQAVSYDAEGEGMLHAVLLEMERQPSLNADDPAFQALNHELRERAAELGTRRGVQAEALNQLIQGVDEPGAFADLVSFYLELETADKQALLEMLDDEERMREALVAVERELARLDAQEEIQARVQEELGERQREMLLREQLKQIQRELGDEDERDDLEDLRDLDAGDGQSMPTLEEVLDAFGAKIPFNLEIKYSRTGAYEGIEARSLEAVQARGLEEATLFSSFFDPVLRELRRLSPAARTALLLSPQWPRDPVDRALAVGAEAINPHSSVVDAGLVEAAHAAGLAVYVFTVDAADEMRRMLDFGVDGLFTNRPDRMRALLAGDPLP